VTGIGVKGNLKLTWAARAVSPPKRVVNIKEPTQGRVWQSLPKGEKVSAAKLTALFKVSSGKVMISRRGKFTAFF